MKVPKRFCATVAKVPPEPIGATPRRGTIDRERNPPGALEQLMIKPALTRLTALLLLSLAFAAGAQELNQAVAKFQTGDYAGALRDLMPFAEQGNPTAQNLVGAIYANGAGGIVRDNLAAAAWIRLAAEQEHTMAQFNLGGLYERGQGVAQDQAEAARWYVRAARLGHAEAQFRLGSMYERGAGVQQDFAEAVRWYRSAAEQDLADAQASLGVMYTTGQGVQQHHGDAVIWFRRAAEQGFARAQYNLAVMYADGLGIEQDRAAAANWYRRSAEQGYVAAQYGLGVAYYRGDGIPQDPVLAHVWVSIAAVSGHENAPGVRSVIAEQLSADDLALAERIALACRQQGYDYCVR